MDMRSRRKFVNEMMAATAMAMGGGMMFGQQATGIHTVPDTAPPYLQIGNVQQGPDGVNGNPPPGQMGGGVGAARPAGAAAGGRGGAPRVPRPKPSGIYWISGTGTERPVPSWTMTDHTKVTMDNLKNGVERMGGTMDSFLYMQVFFCLRSDDSAPMPKGSAAFAAYQKAYEDLNAVYNTYLTGAKPPRSCFALSWIPGNSLIEISAAAWIDPSIVPPPAAPRAPRGGAAPAGAPPA